MFMVFDCMCIIITDDYSSAGLFTVTKYFCEHVLGRQPFDGESLLTEFLKIIYLYCPPDCESSLQEESFSHQS